VGDSSNDAASKGMRNRGGDSDFLMWALLTAKQDLHGRGAASCIALILLGIKDIGRNWQDKGAVSRGANLRYS